MAGFSYLWEFRVRPEQLAAFETAYGPEGDWVRLFRTDPAYLGTELLRDREDPLRCMTVDHWVRRTAANGWVRRPPWTASGAGKRSERSREACQAFRERCRAEYQALDARCAGFTASEWHLGDFDAL